MARPPEHDGPPQLSLVPRSAESVRAMHYKAAMAPGGVGELCVDLPLAGDGLEPFECLVRAGVVTVAQVEARVAEGSLRDVYGIGPAREARIEDVLRAYWQKRRVEIPAPVGSIGGAAQPHEADIAALELRTFAEWLPPVERALARLPAQSRWHWVAAQLHRSILRAQARRRPH